jgi:hypothetical protein
MCHDDDTNFTTMCKCDVIKLAMQYIYTVKGKNNTAREISQPYVYDFREI